MVLSFKNIYTIALREIKSYITSPMIYIVLGCFFLVANMFFVMSIDTFDELCKRLAAEMLAIKLSALDVNAHVLARQLLNVGFVCIFFLPVFTMRLISDEKKNKTIEFLMTSPITSLDIILGKFLAMVVLWIGILLMLFMYPLAVVNLPEVTVDWSFYLSVMFGLFLFGIFCISIGLFASCLTENQLVSAVIGFLITAFLYFIINIAILTDNPIGRFAYEISSYPHLEEFIRGVIDTKNVLYFLLGTTFMLFVSERVLESQRWR